MRVVPTSADERAEVAAVLPVILRTGVTLCFLGHGAFGLMTKRAWLDYFAVAGIGEGWGFKLMPIIGAMDVAVAILAFAWPCRALFFWAAFWTTVTALLRPLAHQGWPEFFERSGNFGVPIAILVAVGLRGPWLARLPEQWSGLRDAVLTRITFVLRLGLVGLLVGHSFCALLLKKPSLAHHYEALGFANPSAALIGVGWFELVLAVAVILIPSPLLFSFACVWKLGTEMFFLTSGTQTPIFEVMERGGSYIIPLALAYLATRSPVGERIAEPTTA